MYDKRKNEKIQAGLSSEDSEQMMLFRWAEFAEIAYPELQLMYHVPNEGKRNAVTGSRLKKMGLKAGVPDIILPVAHGGYIGLAIEMKYGRNCLTEKQSDWLKKLGKAGHKTEVCYSFESAKDVIENYLRSAKTVIVREVDDI